MNKIVRWLLLPVVLPLVLLVMLGDLADAAYYKLYHFVRRRFP